MSSDRRPVLMTDDWIHEQQLRAELEAEAWRSLRQSYAIPAPAPASAPVAAPQPVAPTLDPHRTGSTILKALVRFAMAACGAYLAFLAAADSGLGEFEIWLAVGSAFVVTLALSMFGGVRRLVHMLAETARWVIIAGVAVGALWMATHLSA